MPLVFWLFGTLVGIVAFLLAGIVLDVAQVFGLVLVLFYHFGSVDSSSWMALIVFITLIFPGGLGLRLTISKRGIVKLSLVFVPIPMLPIGFVLVFLA